MTSHEAISGVAGGSVASGAFGLFLSYIQLPSAAAASNLMSLVGIVVGGLILVWQHVTTARRVEHKESVMAESQEIRLLMERNAASLKEIARLTEQNITLQHKMLEVASRQVGCPISHELLEKLVEQGKYVDVKDVKPCQEAAKPSQ